MDDSQSDDEELLNNEDYRNLQEVINMLRKQRDRALKNVNLLQQLKEDALANPMQFVTDLKEKKLVNFPSRQEIAGLPIIDFNKYQKNSAPTSASSTPSSPPTPKTKHNNHHNNSNNNNNNSNPNNNNNNSNGNSNSKNHNSKKSGKVNGAPIENKVPQPGDVVRGRVFTPSKPRSFNKLWSPEEQKKKLEDLLLKYPHEKVAAHRWEKIAKALGTRTPKQVASRTQKYFIKLAKRGLDVPGKMPNLEYYTSSRAKKRKRRQKAAALLNQQRSGNNINLSRSNPTLFKMSDDSDDFSDSDDILSDTDTLDMEQDESIASKKIKISTDPMTLVNLDLLLPPQTQMQLQQ